MDIIDIIIAKTLSTQGSIEASAAQARQAVTEAQAALKDAQDAVSDAQDAATAAAEAAAALTNITDTIDTEIGKLNFQFAWDNSYDSSYISTGFTVTYPDGDTSDILDITRYYFEPGWADDGTMTQHAITQFVNEMASSATVQGNVGDIVVVDNDNKLAASEINIDSITKLLISTDSYAPESVRGIHVNLITKEEYSVGGAIEDCKYLTYRIRCTVSNDGTIQDFIGDTSYIEDGSRGQVMVYQPKFYYRVEVLATDTNNNPTEFVVLLSDYQYPGFSLHPLFNVNDKPDYVLLSAFEGSIYHTGTSTYDETDSSTMDTNNDMLSSIAGVKPTSGANKEFTCANAEKLAANRGAGWHITSMEVESAQQMLMAVEFGTLNIQAATGMKGIVDLTRVNNVNTASLTGSTVAGGTGNAVSTINEVSGTYTSYTENGKVACCYRDVENPWGNLWRFVNGAYVVYNPETASSYGAYQQNEIKYTLGRQTGGNANTNYNYRIPSTENYITKFVYKAGEFLPCEATQDGNSALPVGDFLWSQPGIISVINTSNSVLIGGTSYHGDKAGPFSIATDKIHSIANAAIGARIIYVPAKTDTSYSTNLEKIAEEFTSHDDSK